jgi:hypothetical protein
MTWADVEMLHLQIENLSKVVFELLKGFQVEVPDW